MIVIKKVYLAAPLFNVGEKLFNIKITNILERFGYSVFLPQRDGVLAAELADKTFDEKVNLVFSKDCKALKESDILLFVVDGRVPDEGACVELGMAYSLGKRCYGVRSDVRALEDGMSINPMIMGCIIKLFDNPNEDALLSDIENYLEHNNL